MAGGRTPQVAEESYGLYTGWKSSGKALPKLLRFSEVIPARTGVEFGYIISIRRARGLKLEWSIEHPPLYSGDGVPVPDFTGTFRIPDNDYRFFLGDSPWAPLADMCGPWRLVTRIAGQVVADRVFTLEFE